MVDGWLDEWINDNVGHEYGWVPLGYHHRTDLSRLPQGKYVPFDYVL